MISIKQIQNMIMAIQGSPSFDPADLNFRAATTDIMLGSLSGFIANSLDDLPNPNNNVGRLIYVRSINKYMLSNGVEWTDDFTTTPRPDDAPTGTLYSSGFNNSGQLGDNSQSNRSSPVSVVGGFTDWVSVSCGTNHTVGLLSDGTLWSFGGNNRGQLGIGVIEFITMNYRSSPVSVVGGFTDWVSVSSSNDQTLAIKSDGTIWGFGHNNNGQLGDNSGSNRSSPVSVVGGFTDWESVSSGSYHTVGLLSDGTLWSFGNNYHGQLGIGLSGYTARSSPVSVIGGFTDWESVSCGGNHTVGIRSNGTLWSFGYNYDGQLGIGLSGYYSRSSPVSVVGGFTDWESVSSGRAHTVGIRSNGTLWSFGRNTFGSIGDGTTEDRSSPVSVVGGFTDWVSVSCGTRHTMGIREDTIFQYKSAWSFGRNNFGQLGDGERGYYVDRSSPVSVVGNFSDWVTVVSGLESNHSMFILTPYTPPYTPPF